MVERHSAFLDYHCNDRGRPRSKAYFDQLLQELSTYYGKDYGHRGTYDELVSIGSTWPQSEAAGSR